MKNVIWVFGESATGKSTLINEILTDKNNIRTYLGLNSEKIDVIENTILSNIASFDDEANERFRKEKIKEKITDFLRSDNTVLLIKGQTNDMNDKYGNTLKEFAIHFPNLNKVIYLLEIDNLDLHYYRFVNKDWFQADKERYERIFTREWLPRAVEKHRKMVYSFEQYGFTILNIDSTNGFKMRGDRNLNGEGSNFRR